jgi:hypothetical protein
VYLSTEKKKKMPIILPKDLAVAPPQISLDIPDAYAMLAPNQKKSKTQREERKQRKNR